MKACVNKDSCIGCGLCESISPKVFFMDDDDKAKAVEGEVEASLISEAEEAASSCPVGAIHIE
jgi:ferredoxin